jgi:hypothetical protein
MPEERKPPEGLELDDLARLLQAKKQGGVEAVAKVLAEIQAKVAEAKDGTGTSGMAR